MGHSSQPVLCAYPLSSLPQGAAPSEDEEESLLTIEIEDGDFARVGPLSLALPPRPYPPPQLLSCDTRGGGANTKNTQTSHTNNTHEQPAVSSGSCSSHGDKQCAPRLRPTSPHVHVLDILGICSVRMPSRCVQSSEGAYFACGNPRVSGVGPSVWMRFC